MTNQQQQPMKFEVKKDHNRGSDVCGVKECVDEGEYAQYHKDPYGHRIMPEPDLPWVICPVHYDMLEQQQKQWFYQFKGV